MEIVIKPYEELSWNEEGDWEIKLITDDFLILTYSTHENPLRALEITLERLNYLIKDIEIQTAEIELKGTIG